MFSVILSVCVIKMIRREMERLTEICCKRNWINKDARTWCVYALEKWIRLSLFFHGGIGADGTFKALCWNSRFPWPVLSCSGKDGRRHTKSVYVWLLISCGLVVFVSHFLGDWLILLLLRPLLMLDYAGSNNPLYTETSQFSAGNLCEILPVCIESIYQLARP